MIVLLHNFGSAMSSGFGGLGVSWHGQVPVTSTTIQEPSWDTRRGKGRHSQLWSIHLSLSTLEGGGDNEQKRIASAAYVNYGPTTNNVLAELAAAREKHEQHGVAGSVGSSMLQSSLDDKFNSIYTMPSAYPQAAANTGWTPFTRHPQGDNDPSSLSFITLSLSRAWGIHSSSSWVCPSDQGASSCEEYRALRSASRF